MLVLGVNEIREFLCQTSFHLKGAPCWYSFGGSRMHFLPSVVRFYLLSLLDGAKDCRLFYFIKAIEKNTLLAWA